MSSHNYSVRRASDPGRAIENELSPLDAMTLSEELSRVSDGAFMVHYDIDGSVSVIFCDGSGYGKVTERAVEEMKEAA